MFFIIGQLIEILSPVFICVALGFLWVKRGQEFNVNVVTKLVTIISTPALVFYSLSAVQLAPESYWQMIVAAVFSYALFLLSGLVLLPMLGLSRQAFLTCITFPNIGNMGLPICYLAFGETGLALAIAFFVVYVVLQFTVGIAILQGHFSSKVLIEMPVIPATICAIAFLASDTDVPVWLLNTTKMIGDLTIPLMLFTLGASLTTLKLGNLRTSTSISVIRLLLGLAVGFLIIWVLDLRDEKSAVVLLQCSMPIAIYAYLFAQLYDKKATEVAGAVMISTLSSLVSLPLVLLYLL